MPPRRRRGGETRSWGDANEYGFEHGETVYIGRNDRRHGVVAHELVAHDLPPTLPPVPPSASNFACTFTLTLTLNPSQSPRTPSSP